jgi:uncharacterized RDD family membrane protein YckC
MSSRINNAFPVGMINTREIVRGFDPAKLRAPFLLRCGAIILDYIVFLLIPASSIIFGRLLGYDGRNLLDSEFTNAGWLFGSLLALSNVLILPMISGKSIGKMVTGLRIVTLEGRTPEFSRLLVRHLIGYPITIATFGLGFFVSVLNSRGRALHDLIAGTVVIYGEAVRKIKS